jgi:hypothetical protein
VISLGYSAFFLKCDLETRVIVVNLYGASVSLDKYL